MNCPNCGAQVAQGDGFCGSCGAQLGQQAAQQPTQQMPAAQQPTQQMPPAQPAPQAQPTQQWQQPAAAPPPPRSSGKTVAIIFAIIAILGLCTCAGVGGWLYYAASQAEEALDSIVETTATTDPTDTSGTSTPSDVGIATAREALVSELPSDWVYELAADTPDYVEYWAGPPASEWMSVYIVERGTDGTWYVSEVYDYDMSSFDDDVYVEPSDADLAQIVVEDFLIAIMSDNPNDAQSLTVSPFRDDPASASYSNGDFYDYYIEDVIDYGDGTYGVVATEEWAYGTDTWVYVVVPTEAGLRINDLMPY